VPLLRVDRGERLQRRRLLPRLQPRARRRLRPAAAAIAVHAGGVPAARARRLSARAAALAGGARGGDDPRVRRDRPALRRQRSGRLGGVAGGGLAPLRLLDGLPADGGQLPVWRRAGDAALAALVATPRGGPRGVGGAGARPA